MGFADGDFLSVARASMVRVTLGAALSVGPTVDETNSSGSPVAGVAGAAAPSAAACAAFSFTMV